MQFIGIIPFLPLPLAGDITDAGNIGYPLNSIGWGTNIRKDFTNRSFNTDAPFNSCHPITSFTRITMKF
jgi:hypothetical protein